MSYKLSEPEEYARRESVLNVVITEATTELALSLAYRIFCDDTFGSNQQLFVCFYDFLDKVTFLETTAMWITESAPNLLKGIICTADASVAFKNADIIFCLGVARGYDFEEGEYNESFFKHCVLVAKHHGCAINKYAKKTVKIVVLGNTEATIISRCLKSIPLTNITALSIFNSKLVAAHIAAKIGSTPDKVKNIILWGSNTKYAYPDCRYVNLSDGKILTDEIEVWIRDDLPLIIQNVTDRCWHIRALAYALADHCKLLWNGTPKGEWSSMSVLSDSSYSVKKGIFFSYPVFCSNGEYKIVQDLRQDAYVMKRIRSISKALLREVDAALKICDFL